jgi:hypothetical protein
VLDTARPGEGVISRLKVEVEEIPGEGISKKLREILLSVSRGLLQIAILDGLWPWTTFSRF